MDNGDCRCRDAGMRSQFFLNNLNKNELNVFRRLSTPKKIQDFLEKIPINFSEKRNSCASCMSPRQVLKQNQVHCMEGAMLAAAILLFHGEKPLLLDLKSANHDYDHVVALFKKGNNWGAIGKTNHAVLRYREPVYRDVRELAMSFFHEYFTDDGKKTMRSFSASFNLMRFGYNWITSEKDLWHIADALDNSKHFPILTKNTIASLRKADPVEIEAGKIVQWKR